MNLKFYTIIFWLSFLLLFSVNSQKNNTAGNPKEITKNEKQIQKEKEKAKKKAEKERKKAAAQAAEAKRLAEEEAIEEEKQRKKAEKKAAKRANSNNITDGKVHFGLSLTFTPQMNGYNENVFTSTDALGRGYGELSLDPLSFNLGLQLNVKKPFYDNGKVKWSAIGIYGIRYGREMYSFKHGEAVYGGDAGGQEGYMTAPEGTVDEAIIQSINQSLLGGVRVDIGKWVYMHLVAGVSLILPVNLNYTDGMTGENYSVSPGEIEQVPFKVYDKDGNHVDTLPYTMSLTGSSSLMFTTAFRFGVSALFSEVEFSTSGNFSSVNITVGLDIIPVFWSKNAY